MYSRCWPAPAADRRQLARRNREATRIPFHVVRSKVSLGMYSSQINSSFFPGCCTFLFFLQYPSCLWDLMLRSVLRSVLANLDGSFENGLDGKYSSQFVRSDGSQAHGCDASAGCAIRIPAKLAGSDLCSQVCRQRLGRERKDTILGPLWRRGELPDHRLWHVQLRK